METNMKKILLIFLIMIISVCAFSNVSAADASDIISSDNTSTIETQSLEETMTEELITDNQDTDSNLKSGEDEYRNIQREIDAAEEYSTITLNGNYTCDYLINVNKPVKIVGSDDGAVITFNTSKDYSSPFFNINASNVELNNIKFVNGIFLWGGAVYWEGDNGTIANCEFIDNSAIRENAIGGALLILGNNCKIENSIFTNNHAALHGGAILLNGSACTITNCEFNDNMANGEKSHGGAIALWADNSIISHCKFTNNHCTDYGGAISVLKQNNTIEYCEFYNNYITNKLDENETQGGGAIFSADSDGLTVDNCTFIGNQALEAYGGAISLYINNTVRKSFFKDNMARLGNDLMYSSYDIMFNHFVLDYDEIIADAVPGIPYSELLRLNNTIERVKVNSSVIFSPGLIFEYGSSGSIYVNVSGGKIELENIHVLNHDKAKITYSNNVLTISNLDVGNYTLRVTTTPDENHTAVDGDLNFTVKQATAVIKASKLTVALKSAGVWTITLVDSGNNKGIPNMRLTLKVFTGKKYKTVSVTTNSKGVASYKTKDLTSGTHKIEVSATHSGYKFNTLTSSITVVKQTPLKFKLQQRTNGKSGSLLSYLVSNKNTNKGINGVKIKVLIYTGKKYKTYILTTKKLKGKKKSYNGAIGFATNSFSAGKHKVVFMPENIKYKGTITTSITIQKSATKGIKFFRKI